MTPKTPKRKRISKEDRVPTSSGPVVNLPVRKKLKKGINYDPVAYRFLKKVGASDAFFRSGKVLAKALQPDEDAYLDIVDYLEQGQPDASVRSAGGYFKIKSILRIIPKTCTRCGGTQPLDFNEDPQWKGMRRMMLWHGTKKANVISILENGLKLPTGNRNAKYFGEGIYFGDTILQSGGYCFLEEVGEDVESLYLFLCDVVLGEAQKETKYQYHYYQYGLGRHVNKPFTPNSDYDSVKGCGKEAPDPKGNAKIDGFTWPLGRLKKNRKDPGELEFNEYVVYKTEQVQPKFLVKVKYVSV